MKNIKSQEIGHVFSGVMIIITGLLCLGIITYLMPDKNYGGIFLCIFILLCSIGYNVIDWLYIVKPFQQVKLCIHEIIDIWNSSNGKVENIDEILTICDRLLQAVETIHSFIRFTYFFPISNNKKIQHISLFTYTFSQSILTDLRSDLTIRLAEQQKTLEGAKIEVSENIKGTTELTQVSELQKARLDKQIEQFEELQKVLVKV